MEIENIEELCNYAIYYRSKSSNQIIMKDYSNRLTNIPKIKNIIMDNHRYFLDILYSLQL